MLKISTACGAAVSTWRVLCVLQTLSVADTDSMASGMFTIISALLRGAILVPLAARAIPIKSALAGISSPIKSALVKMFSLAVVPSCSMSSCVVEKTQRPN